MGYAVLHLDKAKGADSGMSAHIERTIHPKNADPTRTHQNRELIQFPDGVTNRTQAIQHRLDTAGLKRKIANNQVRAIRILLTGTHEDMMQIEKNGKLEDWCQDNIDWLQKTYGIDNVVSVVQRTYRKKAPAPRLCADDIMSRANLKRYQNTYAEAMQKYGLQRGIEGSEAQHISTHEYYRSLMAQGKDIQEDVEALLKQKEQAEQELSKIKSERKTEELKNTAAQTATTALKGINSLLGSNKISKLEKENEQLKSEIASRDKQIIKLQADMKQQNEWHVDEVRHTKLQMQSIINDMQSTIDKILRWFPIVGEYLRIERECIKHGFSKEDTLKLICGNAVTFRGYLRLDGRNTDVWAENVTAKVSKIGKDKLQLTVEQTPIAEWIQQLLERKNHEHLIEQQKISNSRAFHL